MSQSLLEIKNLSVEYKVEDEIVKGVDSLSFSIDKGESLGIIGESGSGKTSMAMAIMGLIKKPGQVRGSILFDGKEINALAQKQLNEIRWKRMAIVFQNSLDILNPLLTIHEQIYEVLIKHTHLLKPAINERIDDLLIKVGLSVDLACSYPHELSGGMRQRVLIAMALSCEPELLIVDEPTSALDMVSKNEIIKLLSDLFKENNFALIVISHELDTVLKLTSKVSVMYSGTVVEKGDTSEVLTGPRHGYTKGLLNSSPCVNVFGDMWGIPSERKESDDLGCPFKNRCTQNIDLCQYKKPGLAFISPNRQVSCNRGGIVTLLKGEDICKTFKCKGRLVNACVNCNIHVKSGEVVALIGESGSGKTTLASILSGIGSPDRGATMFEGHLVKGNNFTSKEDGMQMVFQDPFSAINEKLTIEEVVSEPLRIINNSSKACFDSQIQDVLKAVQLPNDAGFIKRKCYTLSGGQRQRVSLARSLIIKPKLLIADEISSMLDPSTQANILRLLKKLQNERGFSMLYITHDLAIARKIADRVYVMSQGEIVESGTATQIFSNPEHDYTKELIGQGAFCQSKLQFLAI